MSSTRFRLNSDEVVSKVIDGEAVIMNLTNGVYYSTDRLGAEIWERVIGHESVEAIRSDLGNRYPAHQSQIASDMTEFVEQLVSEELVFPTSGDETEPSTQTTEPPASGNEDLAFSSPRLVVYRDMGDLLALDPPQPGLEKTAWKDSGTDTTEQNAG